MRRLAVLLLLCLFAAVGCGGSDDATVGEGGGATTAAEPTASEPTPSSPSTTSESSTVGEETAPIVVDEPNDGAQVTSPVAFSGSAQVFEATVSVQLVDDDGAKLTETFVTASCGTSCRGTFQGTIEAPAGYSGPATLRFFESSAKDGSELHVVEVPVRIS